MLGTKFAGVIGLNDGERWLIKPLKSQQKEYLYSRAIRIDVFTTPKNEWFLADSSRRVLKNNKKLN